MPRDYEKTSEKRLQEIQYQLRELKKMRKDSPRVKQLEKDVMDEIRRRD